MNSYYGDIMVKNLDCFSFEEKIKSENNSIIIDVRTLEEFKEVRIPNAILIDIYEQNFLDKINELDKNKPYFVYCRSGVRSLTACQQMIKLGFSKVYNLKDGIISWEGETEQG
ncbi:MAG: rhodanese-like domain-containing protein [Melioribacteraceae bacterium]|nr:rhodanese-like domain-containing protein [Melioribacteraceae bacterium]